tara:strand:+ start:422 stop:1093 length:672 start_codon:yes stop_codon:yes gene_type:complete
MAYDEEAFMKNLNYSDMSEVFDMINEESGEKLNLFQQDIKDIGLDKINILQMDEGSDYIHGDDLKNALNAYNKSEGYNKRYHARIRRGESHSEAISKFPAHIQDEVEAYVESPVKKPKLTSDLDRKIWDLYSHDGSLESAGLEEHDLINKQIWDLKQMADEHIGGDKKSPRHPGDTGSLGRQVSFSRLMNEGPNVAEREDERPMPNQSSRGVTEKIFKKLLGM